VTDLRCKPAVELLNPLRQFFQTAIVFNYVVCPAHFLFQGHLRGQTLQDLLTRQAVAFLSPLDAGFQGRIDDGNGIELMVQAGFVDQRCLDDRHFAAFFALGAGDFVANRLKDPRMNDALDRLSRPLVSENDLR